MGARWRVLAAVNVALWGAIVAGLLRLGVRFGDLGWDLESFCVGSRLWLDGQPVYDFAAQARAHVALAHPGFAPFPFVNPPILAIEMAPLAKLPHAVALLVVIVASLAAAVVAARLVTGDARNALWVAASYPALTALGQGQLAFFALLLFSLTYYALARRRPFTAGAVASLLVYKPQLLLLLPVAFAMSPLARRALAGFVAGVLAQLGICLLVARDATLAFPSALARFASYAPNLKVAESYTWRTFFELLLPGHPRASLGLAAAAILTTLAVAVAAMWRARRDLELLFSIAVIATLLGAAHCGSYEWVSLALPAWLLAPRAAPSRRALALYVVASAGLWFDVVDWQRDRWGVALAPAMLVGSAFAVWLVRAAWRSGTTSASAAS
ncbi:MAG TPA: glycosyltransferase family 87 protein [Polyangiaceae bacterium]|nr:glycosyltransferase family 87 protein [Polyangiaceae bacterium]